MSSVKKAIKTVAHYATGGLVSKGDSGGSDDSGATSTASSTAVSQNAKSQDMSGSYDNSLEVSSKGASSSRRKGKSSLKVDLGGSGRNLASEQSSRKGLNVV